MPVIGGVLVGSVRGWAQKRLVGTPHRVLGGNVNSAVVEVEDLAVVAARLYPLECTVASEYLLYVTLPRKRV